MSYCENCKKYDDCASGSGLTWPCGAYVPKLITNADRIRDMSDEENVKRARRKDRCRPVSEMILMMWRSSRREVVNVRRNERG